MASTMPKPVKQLGELLQEQQEPFVLEVYLFERGYVRKCLNSNRECSNSSKTLNRSSSYGLIKSKKGTLRCPKILRSLYNKLVLKNSGPSNFKSSEKEEAEKQRNGQEIGESDRFSSASSRTQYDSCTDEDKDEEATVSLQNDHASDNLQSSQLCNMKEGKIEELNGESSKTHCKQNTPISVLEDIPPSQAVKLQAMSREEDSILSASLWELLFYPALEKPRGSGVSEMLEPVRSNDSNPSPHFAKSKRMLQQTRQLLFDCVREMTETHAKKDKEQQQHHYKTFMGAEELGKLIYEKLGTWGQQAGDEANINFLLDLDFLGSAEEWNYNYHETREVGSEIGDAILEEMIKEIVAQSNCL